MKSAIERLSAKTVRCVGIRGALVVSLLCGSPRIEAASAADPAETFIEMGVRARRNDRPADALELFRKAHALSPTARSLGQMGLAECSLRQWIEAEGHLADALAARDTRWIDNRRNKRALELALAIVRSHIGVLSIDGPLGTAVTLNGKPSGMLPLSGPIKLAEGTVLIEANALGRRPAALQVEISGGTTTTVPLDLGPLMPSPFPTDHATDGERPISQPESSTTWETWAGAALLVVSAGGLTAGGVWLALDGRRACAQPTVGQCPWAYDTKMQGWAAMAVGTAAGLAGGFLLWKGRLDAGVSVGPGGLEAFGHF